MHARTPVQELCALCTLLSKQCPFSIMCDLLQIIELYVRGITVRGLADPRHW